MNQQFWVNHVNQDTLPTQMLPSARMASFGERSLSGPNSREGEAAPELRKYMPAGQKVSGGGALIDDTTGLVNINQQPAGGVWSLMIDGSAQAAEPARRMRSVAQCQQPSIDPHELKLAEKMKWNPEAEAQHAANREYHAKKWENAPSALPGQNSSQPEIMRNRRPVERVGSSSLSLGWDDSQPQLAPPLNDRSSAAPWLQEDASTSRSSRRAVGGDHNKSKVSWGGYGNNDPSLTVNEPIGVLTETDRDCFAIGNSRSEKFILRSGRIRGAAQPVQQDSIDLKDNAFSDQLKFRPSVAQACPQQGFFNVSENGMANPDETNEWAPSGQPRRAPEGLERSQGMAIDHMGRPIHQAPSPKPHQPPPQPSPPPPQYQQMKKPSPARPLEPAPWGVNYDVDTRSKEPVAGSLVTPFDCDGVSAPSNIHFHVLDTTQAHPKPHLIPGQPDLPNPPLSARSSRIRPKAQDSPRGYTKAGPGFGHVPLNQQPQPQYQQQQHNQPQPQYQQPQHNQPQPQYQQQQHNQPQPQYQQQQHNQPQQCYQSPPNDIDFGTLSEEDRVVVNDFVGWYQGTYSETPPLPMVKRALLDARNKRSASPPQHPQLSPLQSPRKSVRGEEEASEKKMGGRSFAMGSGGGQTMNQGNSILGRRSTRVAAPPGGTSSFSLGGF